MKIRYGFVNESIEIEVEDGWGQVVLAEEHRLDLNNRRETRRHVSLDGLDFEGGLFESEADTEGEALQRVLGENLRSAVSELQPQQQELLHQLYVQGLSFAAIARAEGVGESAIRDRHKRILQVLKKVLNRPCGLASAVAKE